jgi:hypothetical protein
VPESPDRVEVVRTGGFAGIPRRGSIDLTGATPDERERVDRALADLRSAAAKAPADALARPDAFTYSVAAVGGGAREETVVPEHALPESARPLVDRALREP